MWLQGGATRSAALGLGELGGGQTQAVLVLVRRGESCVRVPAVVGGLDCTSGPCSLSLSRLLCASLAIAKSCCRLPAGRLRAHAFATTPAMPPGHAELSPPSHTPGPSQGTGSPSSILYMVNSSFCPTPWHRSAS